MARKKTSTPAALHIPQPLHVQIQPQPNPQAQAPAKIAKFAAIGVVCLFLASLSFALWLLHTAAFTFENTALPARIYLDKPRTASLRDPFSVTVVLYNLGSARLNGVMTLNVHPAFAISLQDDPTQSSLKVQNLAPGASLTRTFAFVPLQVPPNYQLNLSVHLKDDQYHEVQTDPARAAVRVLGIPRLLAALTWIFGGGGLLAALTGLFWERVKRGLR